MPIDAEVDLFLIEGASGGSGGTEARTVPLPSGLGALVASGAGVTGIQRLRWDAPGVAAVATTTAGATHIAAVVVPTGGALVFAPAALVGAAVPRGARLPVTRKSCWGDIRCWARFRFRHYVFTGPGTLLLQGRYGLRARPAGGGWGEDARLTVAFDAHLARGAGRRGSLWRFVTGRQALFDDRFDGDGTVYAEQQPSRAMAANPVSRLLQWIGEVILKVFGLG